MILYFYACLITKIYIYVYVTYCIINVIQIFKLYNKIIIKLKTTLSDKSDSIFCKS